MLISATKETAVPGAWRIEKTPESPWDKRKEDKRHCCNLPHSAAGYELPSFLRKVGRNCPTTHWVLPQCGELTGVSATAGLAEGKPQCFPLLSYPHRTPDSTAKSHRAGLCSFLQKSHFESGQLVGQNTDSLYSATVGVLGISPRAMFTHSAWASGFPYSFLRLALAAAPK